MQRPCRSMGDVSRLQGSKTVPSEASKRLRLVTKEKLRRQKLLFAISARIICLAPCQQKFYSYRRFAKIWPHVDFLHKPLCSSRLQSFSCGICRPCGDCRVQQIRLPVAESQRRCCGLATCQLVARNRCPCDEKHPQSDYAARTSVRSSAGA